MQPASTRSILSPFLTSPPNVPPSAEPASPRATPPPDTVPGDLYAPEGMSEEAAPLPSPWLAAGFTLLALVGAAQPAHAATPGPVRPSDSVARTLPSGSRTRGSGRSASSSAQTSRPDSSAYTLLPPGGPSPMGLRAPVEGRAKGQGLEAPTSLSPSRSLDTSLAGPRASLRSSDGTIISVDQSNDSFPFPSGTIPSRDKDPFGNTDDNGWTAGLRAQVVNTQGRVQWVGAVGYDMLTERGSWEPQPGYQGLRQDLAELAVQRNVRVSLDAADRHVLDYGVGLGLQAVGPLGGLALQQAVHNGPIKLFQGRSGPEEGLQSHYTTAGVHVAPLLTGGVALTHALNERGTLQLRESLQAALPVGQGVSVARAGIALEAMPSASWRVSAGVHVDAVHNSYRPLDYMKLDGVRPGLQVHTEYTGFGSVRPYFGVTYGGMRNEANYYVGVSIPLGGSGRGEAARLNPLFK